MIFLGHVAKQVNTSETSDKYLTLPNPIFLPPAYSPALIYFGRERGWWITCNYPAVIKRKTYTERVQPALSVG
jgi:hypothetical protein